ncbi:hypothetical protein DIPPA_20430 [Diplonema papillatum]|nr:hypothetical protein DIPPA_20430 [Diplonema papillatum]
MRPAAGTVFAVVLALVPAAFGNINCVTYSCPLGAATKGNGDLTCPDTEAGLECTPDTKTNDAACCTESQIGADDFTPLIAVNMIGAIPLSLVIALTIWAVRTSNKREEEERERVDAQGLLFKNMEQESLRRSYRSSMFMHSSRRKTMAGGRKISMSTPVAAITRAMLLTLRRGPGGDLGFSLDDMVICSVDAGSPAYEAGLAVGMKVVKINGQPVTQDNVAETIREAGDAFTITVYTRDGPSKNMDRSASLPNNTNLNGTYSALAAPNKGERQLVRIRLNKENGVLGMQVTELEVSSLKPGGPAERAGVRLGSQVHAVNGLKVTSANVSNIVATAGDSFLVDFICDDDDENNMLEASAALSKQDE